MISFWENCESSTSKNISLLSIKHIDIGFLEFNLEIGIIIIMEK